VIAVVGFCFGLGGVVGESGPQSQGMRKDGRMMMKVDRKTDGVKTEDTKKDGKAMKKDDKMTKDDKAMEKKQ